jgi:hypothetical protein
MTTAALQLSALISMYMPDVARQFRGARSSLRKYFPRGYELVFENFNALGCGYSFTDRGSGVVVSVVAYPKWVTLFFFHGIDLLDPDGLLRGDGARIRSIRLEPFSILRSSSVRDLLLQVTKRHRRHFATAPPLAIIVKAVANKRRARRPAPLAKTGTGPKWRRNGLRSAV